MHCLENMYMFCPSWSIIGLYVSQSIVFSEEILYFVAAFAHPFVCDPISAKATHVGILRPHTSNLFISALIIIQYFTTIRDCWWYSLVNFLSILKGVLTSLDVDFMVKFLS